METITRKGISNKFFFDELIPLTEHDHKKFKKLEQKVTNPYNDAPFPYQVGSYSYVNMFLNMLILALLLTVLSPLAIQSYTMTGIAMIGLAIITMLFFLPYYFAYRENKTGTLIHPLFITPDIKWLSANDLSTDMLYENGVGNSLTDAYTIAEEKDTPTMWRAYTEFSNKFLQIANIQFNDSKKATNHKKEQIEILFENYKKNIEAADKEIMEKDEQALAQIASIVQGAQSQGEPLIEQQKETPKKEVPAEKNTVEKRQIVRSEKLSFEKKDDNEGIYGNKKIEIEKLSNK